MSEKEGVDLRTKGSKRENTFDGEIGGSDPRISLQAKLARCRHPPSNVNIRILFLLTSFIYYSQDHIANFNCWRGGFLFNLAPIAGAGVVVGLIHKFPCRVQHPCPRLSVPAPII